MDEVKRVQHIIKELNGNQARAVVKSITSEDYALIQGFPGAGTWHTKRFANCAELSGKTSTIVCLVRCIVELGRSVLLTAFTNSAVDNMLLRIQKVF